MATEIKPCIGMLEFGSIAIGIKATDAMLKKATIKVVLSSPISKGKYITIINGEVEDVLSSLEQGREMGVGSIIDELFIPNLHPMIIPAIEKVQPPDFIEALGILETQTCPTCIIAADAALKTGVVSLITMRLAQGIGGKAYFILAGEVGDVEVAILAGSRVAKQKGTLINEVIIPQAHPDMWQVLIKANQIQI